MIVGHDSMGPFLVIATLLLVCGAVVVAVGILYWIMWPLEALSRTRPIRSQFTLSDLLVLFVMLQMIVGTVHYLTIEEAGFLAADSRPLEMLLIDGGAALITLVSWWCGVGVVSRAGIDRWWHRAVIVALVVPLGACSALISLFLLILAICSMFSGAARLGWLAAFSAWSALTAVIAACGLLTRWIAAKYQPRAAEGQPDAERTRPLHSDSTET